LDPTHDKFYTKPYLDMYLGFTSGQVLYPAIAGMSGLQLSFCIFIHTLREREESKRWTGIEREKEK
jgi:hypothetical protein